MIENKLSSELVKLKDDINYSKEYNKYIGKTFTKKEFYDKFPNFNPYKVMRSDMIHNGYTYKIKNQLVNLKMYKNI